MSCTQHTDSTTEPAKEQEKPTILEKKKTAKTTTEG